jgi:hypothetical protein
MVYAIIHFFLTQLCNTNRLSHKFDGAVAKNFLEQMLSLITTPKPSKLGLSNDHLTNLRVCNATEALGMKTYARHIAEHYKAIAKSNNMPYRVVDTISNMDTSIARVLFNEAAQAMRTASFKGQTPAPDEFAAHLATNAHLHDAIADVHVKLQAAAEANNAEREAYFVREACRQSKKEAEALLSPAEKGETCELKEKKAEYWAKTQKEHKAKEKREAELVAVVREKLTQRCDEGEADAGM